MPFNPLTFEQQLDTALSTFDKEGATELCTQFMQYLYTARGATSSGMLEHTLQSLRNKRMFSLMQQVGDSLIELGLQTYKIQRQYAQSLIDQGIYAAALCLLQQLKAATHSAADPAVAGEHAEATGLIGRIYKQRYLNAGQPGDARIADELRLAIQYYEEAYRQDPARNYWHGINLVALLCRASRDGIDVNGLPEPRPIADDLLTLICELDNEHKTTIFDLATACEACVALGRPDEALLWAERYINSAADEFELASTLRQMQEVWGLTIDHPIGKLLLPILNAALLKRQGATVTMSSPELIKQTTPDPDFKLERLLGPTSVKTYQWYLKGLKACTAVARIGRDSSQGFGTGFLLDGGSLAPDLAGRIVLFTNAHIVSNDTILNVGSRYPDQVVVTLECVDRELELRLDKILFSSSFLELDTTILTFDAASEAQLSALKPGIYSYPLARRFPDADGKQRVYIIGHPNGGTLSISLQDNILLARNERMMHYRTPTQGGNSGSPVFNDEWELIGIHHGGSDRIRPLDGQGQPYAANEGIRLDAIRENFDKQRSPADANRVIFP